jgi:hypothetical protein
MSWAMFALPSSHLHLLASLVAPLLSVQVSGFIYDYQI